MFCKNKFGRIVDVDDNIAKKNIERGVFVAATKEEIESHIEKKKRIHAESLIDSVYFSTVDKRSDGYGMSREHIEVETGRAGTALTATYTGQDVGLLYGYPQHIVGLKTRVRVVYTMFESTKIPSSWVEHLEAADIVLVPSTFCKKALKDSGIESRVVPLGYNNRVFAHIDRPVPVEQGTKFRFIHYDSFNIRKGFSEVVNAFREEFQDNEPVELILKTTKKHLPFPFIPEKYPNIRVVQEDMTESDLCSLLGKANVMVFPSMGEGFGITPLEAMATGIPAIIPNAHGISEYFNSECMIEVDTEEVPAVYRKYKGEDLGVMVKADVKNLRQRMRYAYNHQAEMKELGRKASEYVAAYTYEKTGQMLSVILEEAKSLKPNKKFEKYLAAELV